MAASVESTERLPTAFEPWRLGGSVWRQLLQEPNDDDPGREVLMTLYQVLESRRSAYDTLLWHIPILGLTAQAFLFTVALSPDRSASARSITSFLALMTALISLQMLFKLRYFEMKDSKACKKLEIELGIDRYFGFPPHSPTLERLGDGEHRPGWLVRPSSFKFLVTLVVIFAGASALIIFMNTIRQLL
jgi:hypothetical protein